MERLTTTSNKGGVALTFDLDITCNKSETTKILKLAEKLKEYEDFEEIFRSKMTDAACEFLKDKEEFARWLDRNKWIAKKCDEYARAEEQKKLLKLPCALGDWVQIIKKNGDIDLHKVVAIEIDEDGAYCKSSYRFGKLEDFGKTIFFSEEEAEAAKREMN